MSDRYNTYIVDEAYESYDSNRFNDLHKAEDHARTRAYQRGEDYGIFKIHAIAKRPEIVNTVAVEEVK